MPEGAIFLSPEAELEREDGIAAGDPPSAPPARAMRQDGLHRRAPERRRRCGEHHDAEQQWVGGHQGVQPGGVLLTHDDDH